MGKIITYQTTDWLNKEPNDITGVFQTLQRVDTTPNDKDLGILVRITSFCEKF